jgi:hypothetical protein
MSPTFSYAAARSSCSWRSFPRLGGEGVQIFERSRDEQLTCSGRARQLLDRIVHLEHERIGQPAHTRKMPLGTLALLLGDARFAQGGKDSAEQRQRQNTGGRNLHLVTAHELPGAIAEVIAAREDRQPFEMAADVFGKQVHRPIALVGFLAGSPPSRMSVRASGRLSSERRCRCRRSK